MVARRRERVRAGANINHENCRKNDEIARNIFWETPQAGAASRAMASLRHRTGLRAEGCGRLYGNDGKHGKNGRTTDEEAPWCALSGLRGELTGPNSGASRSAAGTAALR